MEELILSISLVLLWTSLVQGAHDRTGIEHLKIFGRRDYLEIADDDNGSADNTKCHEHHGDDKMSPYTLCVLEADVGLARSVGAVGIEGWEKHITNVLLAALEARGAVLLDIGGHVGAHSIPAAARGFRVYAVEAMTRHLKQFYRSLELSGLLDLVTLINNAADIESGRNVTIHAANTEIMIGASVIPEELRPPDDGGIDEEVRTARLSDFLELMHQDLSPSMGDGPIPVVIKMDIETMECKVVMGSLQSFFDKRFEIPYVIMEWLFFYNDDFTIFGVANHCPKALEEMMFDTMVDLGYEPFVQLDANAVLYTWPPTNIWRPVAREELMKEDLYTNVLWRKRGAVDILRRSERRMYRVRT